MDRDALKQRLAQQLRTLRDANDQKAAVAWMRDSYLLMEAALRELDQVAPAAVFMPAGPLPLAVTTQTRVYAVRDSVLHRHPHIWLQGETVRYPDPPPFIHPPPPAPLLLVERHEPIPPRRAGRRKRARTAQQGR